jgi:hypothetical protein
MDMDAIPLATCHPDDEMMDEDHMVTDPGNQMMDEDQMVTDPGNRIVPYDTPADF